MNGTQMNGHAAAVGVVAAATNGKKNEGMGPPPAKFSISLSTSSKASSKPNPNSTSTPSTLKRPHALLFDDFTDASLQTEEITTFSAASALLSPEERKIAEEKRKEESRVISSLPNRDWREESKRKRMKSAIPGQEQGRGQLDFKDVVNSGAGVAYGLTVAKKAEADELTPRHEELVNLNARDVGEMEPPIAAQTVDEEALSALMGTRAAPTTTIRPASPPPTEDDAFRDSYSSAPRMATLEEYTATPVDGFGAAILRGYLKEGETLDSRNAANDKGKEKARVPARRPAGLGLGAKDSGVEGVELGAWGGRVGRGGGRPERGGRREEVVYNPVALRNRKTGEVISEEEMKKRVQEQEAEDRFVMEEIVARRIEDEQKDSDRGRHRKEHGHVERGNDGDRKRRRIEDVDRDREDDRRHRKRDRSVSSEDGYYRSRRRHGESRRDGKEDDGRRSRRTEEGSGRKEDERDGHRRDRDYRSSRHGDDDDYDEERRRRRKDREREQDRKDEKYGSKHRR